MTNRENEGREEVPSLLPRGWAAFLLVVVLIVLAVGYWIGLSAEPPVHP